MLTGLSVPLLGFVDIAVLGHLDDSLFLAAGAVGIAVMHFLFWLFGFLRMGTTGITAQLYGGGELKTLVRCFHQVLFLGLFLAGILILLKGPLVELVLYLYHPGQSLRTLISDYVDVRIWAAPATFANFIFWGVFLGLQKPLGPLVLMLFVNTLNAVLDVFFVFYMGLDVAGVALASVIAEYCGLIPAIWLLRRLFPAGFSAWRVSEWKASQLWALLSLNYYLFLRTLLLLFAFFFFNLQSAKLGAEYVSANAILINMLMFTAFALDGFAYAIETLVGYCAGRRDLVGTKKFLAAGWLWAGLLGGCFSLFYGFGGGWLIHLLTDLPEVQVVAEEFLYWMVLMPLLCVVPFFYDGVFIGLLRFKEMMVCLLFATLVVYLPLWYFLRDFGNDGLWMAMCAFMLARGLVLHIWYLHWRANNTLFAEPGRKIV